MEKIEAKILASLDKASLLQLNQKQELNNISILLGPSALILYNGIRHLNKPSKRRRAHIFSMVEKHFRYIENASDLSPTYCNGLAGFFSILLFLKEKNIIDIENSSFKNIDYLLSQACDQYLAASDFDLLHGATGLALYFLRRKKKKNVCKVIDRLWETGERVNDEIKWQRYNPNGPEDYIYDLGLSHGNAGILYFLLECHKNNLEPKKCKTLIIGLLKFFKHNIQSIEEAGSFFPVWLNKIGYPSNKYETKSRLAWCYGDLGIITVLIKSSLIGNVNRIFNITDLESMARELGERYMKEHNEITNLWFCHGKLGANLLLKEIYRHFPLEILKIAIDTSQNEIITIFSNPQNIANSEFGLLNGISTLGLCFIEKDADPAWKDFYFI